MARVIYLSSKARHLEVHRVFGEKAGMTSCNRGGGCVVVSTFRLGMCLKNCLLASPSLATVETSAEPYTLKVAVHFLHLYLANDF